MQTCSPGFTKLLVRCLLLEGTNFGIGHALKLHGASQFANVPNLDGEMIRYRSNADAEMAIDIQQYEAVLESRFHLSQNLTNLPQGFCQKTPTFWLHIPKCGTSFISSVQGCKIASPKYDLKAEIKHAPLPLSLNEKFAVAMFRDPNQRLASGYAYASNMPFVLGGGLWGIQDHELKTEVVHRLQEGKNPASDKLLGEEFLGCQTNMVLGRQCMEGTPRDVEDAVQKAAARVDKFRFVGLQEKWELSICLFNYLTSGKRFISKSQIFNTRKTTGKKRSEYNTRGFPHDVYDSKLYAHVVRRFKADLKEHDISIKTCSFTFEGEPIDMERM